MYTWYTLDVFLEVLRYVSFVLALIVNLILLFLIILNVHKELGVYKYFLLAFVVSDILYSFAHFVIVPVPETYKNAFFMSGHGWFTSRWAISVWAIVYSSSFPLLVANFLYRYVAVKYPLRIDIFTQTRVIILLIFIFFINVSVWFCVTHFLWGSPDYPSYVLPVFHSNNSDAFITHDILDFDHYIVVVYWHDSTSHGIGWRAFLGSLTLAVIAGNAYSFMFTSAVGIVEHLKGGEKSAISSRSIQLHKQLFRALVYQAILPFFTAYAPLALCCLIPFFGIDYPLFSLFCPPFCAVHPLIDGTITLFTISQFRNDLLHFFHRRTSATHPQPPPLPIQNRRMSTKSII